MVYIRSSASTDWSLSHLWLLLPLLLRILARMIFSLKLLLTPVFQVQAICVIFTGLWSSGSYSEALCLSPWSEGKVSIGCRLPSESRESLSFEGDWWLALLSLASRSYRFWTCGHEYGLIGALGRDVLPHAWVGPGEPPRRSPPYRRLALDVLDGSIIYR